MSWREQSKVRNSSNKLNIVKDRVKNWIKAHFKNNINNNTSFLTTRFLIVQRTCSSSDSVRSDTAVVVTLDVLVVAIALLVVVDVVDAVIDSNDAVCALKFFDIRATN